MLLFVLDGLLLLRLAERQFCALLFQLPPRITRFEPDFGPHHLRSSCEDRIAQITGIAQAQKLDHAAD